MQYYTYAATHGNDACMSLDRRRPENGAEGVLGEAAIAARGVTSWFSLWSRADTYYCWLLWWCCVVTVITAARSLKGHEVSIPGHR